VRKLVAINVLAQKGRVSWNKPVGTGKGWEEVGG
jgi:hypothetical protein